MSQQQTMTDLETTIDTYAQHWYLPITPADLDAAGVLLDAPLGIDADERATLADEPDIARIRFGVYCDPVDEGDACVRTAIVQAYQIDAASRAGDDGALAPHWVACDRRWYGTRADDARAQADNDERIWDVVRAHIADVDAAVDAALAEYEAAFTEDNDA